MNKTLHLGLNPEPVHPSVDKTEKSQSTTSRKTRLSVNSLFAGIGGFDRAFELAGAEVKFQCELDPFCRSVLSRHWPNAELKSDIKLLQPNDIPKADVWTAGFPCQDVSLARGNHGRTGLRGKQTSLFYELMALVEVAQPKVILLENVVGLLNSHKGQDFAIILKELMRRDYAVSWRVLNARYFGAPQSRSRVFICAWKGDYRRAIESLYEGEVGAKTPRERLGFITPTVHKTGAIVPETAYCVAATSGRHTGNDWARSYISYSDRVRRPTPTESERLQGFPAGWSMPLDDYATPLRGLDSDRYKAVGNAVAVPVVDWIAKRISSVIQKKYPGRRRNCFESDVLARAPDLENHSQFFNVNEILHDVEEEGFSYRWKSGGCAWGDHIVEGKASQAPSEIIGSRFVDALDDVCPDDRYFLTANAAAGIIRRADSVGRTLFSPMRHALERMVSKIAAE
ncbi:DNA (cytosine-5-)-methyltransferase [Phaeobacter sp. G2]|nr:DNA (cytosine-5-)-methyltransferase [Phaeobacter sp. G2]